MTPVIIGNATLYHGDPKELTRSQRYRLRKKGIAVPFVPQRSGFKQTAEHIAKRVRCGEDHHAWLGDAVSERGGRTRALRAFPDVGSCARCGEQKAERHHTDGNTANNEPTNIDILCRRCHMEADGRMEKARQWRKK